MSVGAGSLKRTAKSVSTSKTDNAQNKETVEVKRQTPAKQAAPKKAAFKTTTGKKAVAAPVEKEEQPESTSGIKCELPVYLL